MKQTRVLAVEFRIPNCELQIDRSCDRIDFREQPFQVENNERRELYSTDDASRLRNNVVGSIFEWLGSLLLLKVLVVTHTTITGTSGAGDKQRNTTSRTFVGGGPAAGGSLTSAER